MLLTINWALTRPSIGDVVRLLCAGTGDVCETSLYVVIVHRNPEPSNPRRNKIDVEGYWKMSRSDTLRCYIKASEFQIA